VQSRTILLFENSIKSEQTKKQYNYQLKRFVKFCRLKEFESLLSIDSKTMQTMLEDYIIDMKTRVKPGTIKVAIAAIELYFVVNDKVDINFRKLRKLIPSLGKPSGRKAWSTANIEKMLNCTLEIRSKAIIHLMASTGCRIGAIPDLRMCDVMDIEDGCKVLTFYRDDSEEYVGFLTPEASECLDIYLDQRKRDGEVFNDDSPLFRNQYRFGSEPTKPMSVESMANMVKRILRLTNLRGVKNGRRYDVQQNHGFRKRFNTILKMNNDIAPAITEKLMGHKIALDGVYFVPEIQDLFAEFRKAIPELTINIAKKQEMKITKLEQEKQELEEKNTEIAKLKKIQTEQIENQKIILNVLKNKGIIP